MNIIHEEEDIVTLQEVKDYLNIMQDDTSHDNTLKLLILTAQAYIVSYTGLKVADGIEMLNLEVHGVLHEKIYIQCYPELKLCALQIISSSFNNRDHLTEQKLNVSPFVRQILNMHRRNFC